MANYVRYQLRGDTAENWEAKNPVLLDREPGYDKTARRFKVGDGATEWDGLDYVKPKIIANLLSTSDTDALSASQGAVLKGLIPIVVDDLTTSDSEKALSAKQGVVLKGLIPPVVDNLTTADGGKALSANQGVVLKGLIPPIVDNLTDSSSEAKTKKVLSAYQGYYIKTLLDKKANSTTVTTLQTTVNKHTTEITELQTAITNIEGVIVRDDLTHDEGDTALSARQGKVLKGLIDGKADKTDITSLQTTVNGKANSSDLTALQTALSALQTKVNQYSSEQWTFTLSTGSTVTKKVVLSS